MSVFEGIEHVSAEGTSNRRYFEPGRYLVEIERVFIHEKRLGGRLFIAETTIKESDNPNIKTGEQRNWVQSISNEFALPRIKSFIGAAMGFCPRRQSKELNTQVDTQACNNAVSDENPLQGAVLRVDCINKITRAGKEFTQASWGVIDG